MEKNYEAVIGLEIHIQLKTRSKMFCSSPNSVLDAPPNTHICEVCTGQPGSLPVPNREAIRKAALVGLALGCKIASHSKFDRKNYFYPDLPKGYQISQYDEPISANGKLGTIRIRRAHLEEDTGKLIHQGNVSLVDFNRAGVPLLEVVTEPDFRTAQEVKEFLQELRNIVRYLDVSDGDMEKGHLRGEPNISVRGVGEKDLPKYKVELKNLNSFKAVFDSLNYEIKRQAEAHGAGEPLANETRGWNGVVTVVQRVKEEAQDYRYFPEPDLPMLLFSEEFVSELRASLPELPQAKLARFSKEFGLIQKDAQVLIADKHLASYFEEVVSELAEWMKAEGEKNADIKILAKLASNWIAGELTALLKEANQDPQDSKITAENMAELIKMIDRGEISSTAGKKILQTMFEKGGDPSNIAIDEGLGQVSDEGAIGTAINEAISENPQPVADYKAGKKQALGVLVGKVMAKTGGRANPQVVNQLLLRRL